MTSKNKGFGADLASFMVDGNVAAQPQRTAVGILSTRSNRLAELASGAVVTRTHELVDPARCRMWEKHNRAYGDLSEERCADLIESFKAQGRQEVPAIVRRLRGGGEHDYEVICGARRHWTVSWLRRHNYPDFKFLVEVRELTDEEAFRLSDLENRARADLTDVERAADYLQALASFYGGHQKTMAERLNVTESWLSRYLDLARLPNDLVGAFSSRADLRIKHVTKLKPLLKPEDRAQRVVAAARELAARRGEGGPPLAAADVVRLLEQAAEAPKKSGKGEAGAAPKKSGSPEAQTILAPNGRTMISYVERARAGQIDLTLHLRSGASRSEAEEALRKLLEDRWPTGSDTSGPRHPASVVHGAGEGSSK